MKSNRVYDFRNSMWGHALMRIEIKSKTTQPTWWRKLLGDKPTTIEYYTTAGHASPLPGEGSLFLVTMTSGNIGKFRVKEIEYVPSVRDMFDIKRMDYEGCLEGPPPKSFICRESLEEPITQSVKFLKE